MNTKYWNKLIAVANSAPYGDLPSYITKNDDLRFLTDKEEVKSRIKGNPQAWDIYRSWLKLYEADQKTLKASRDLLISVLAEPIIEQEDFQMALSRAGQIKMWNSECLKKLHGLVTSQNNTQIFNWEIWNNQTDLSSRYPWYTLLACWGQFVLSEKITPDSTMITELLSKKWPSKARCLIAAIAIKNITLIEKDNLESRIQSLIEWANPSIKSILDSLITDTLSDNTQVIYEVLMTKAVSQNYEDKKTQTEINNIIRDMDFTFEW